MSSNNLYEILKIKIDQKLDNFRLQIVFLNYIYLR